MRRMLVIGAVAAVLTLSGCSGDETTAPSGGTATEPTRPSGPVVAPHGDDPAPGATAGAGGPTIERFEVPTSATCAGDTTTVTVRYDITGATAVAFLVDQQSVAGGPDPPLGGTHDLVLPCDGRTHTVVLVAVGADGQTLDSRAVRTEPGP